jgi:hypothetical protein
MLAAPSLLAHRTDDQLDRFPGIVSGEHIWSVQETTAPPASPRYWTQVALAGTPVDRAAPSTYVEFVLGLQPFARRITMTKRRSLRTGVLDWWQTVLDETKSFVDDGIGRLRDDDDERALASDVAKLKRSLATLNARLDDLARGSSAGTSKR